MPVVTIRATKTKSVTEGASLMQKVQQKTTDLLDAADRVLVVYEPSGANIYYEGGSRLKTGAN